MRIGIDLGGTKIEGIVLDGDRAVARHRVATPSGDYQATLEAVAGLVQHLEKQVEGSGLPVGIGHPGSLSAHSGLLRNANSTCLNKQPFAADIQARLQRPVRLANDANCLALSELHDGAAKGCQSVFLVILGTGVGGAVVQQGRLQVGVNGLAGEWGHNPLPWVGAEECPGPACWCGQAGCIEAWLSGPAISRLYHAAGGEAAVSVQELSRRADAGESLASRILDEHCHRLARALASVINLLDPELIVLAGGLSRLGYLYDELPRRWQQWVFAEKVETRIAPAQHGDASGVFGAARLDEQDA